MLDAAVLLLFPALMVFAAMSDLLTMTIPNRISIALAVSFIAMAVASRLPASEILCHLTSGALVLTVGFGLFVKGWIGGGDAKLAAGTAVWLGFEHLGEYGLFAGALGGLLALSILWARKWPLPGFLAARGWIVRLHAPGTGVPYGIALAGAGLILYPDSAIWLAAAASP